MRIGLWLALTTGLLANAVALEAQQGLKLGAGGGASFSSGDVGWNALGLIGYTPASWRVGFRIDGFYNSIDGDPFGGALPFDTSVETKISGGLFSLVYQTREANSYLLAGAGACRISASTTILGVGGSAARTDFAAGGGVGFTIPLSKPVRILLEGRFIRIFSSDGHTDLVPVTLGLTFGLHS